MFLLVNFFIGKNAGGKIHCMQVFHKKTLVKTDHFLSIFFLKENDFFFL